ncbi:MAG TPA: hypothetical protein VF787_26595 [Thermoanaerobaculia bacterium]
MQQQRPRLPISKNGDGAEGAPQYSGTLPEFRDVMPERNREPWHKHPVFIAALSFVLTIALATATTFLTMRVQVAAQEKLNEARVQEQARINAQTQSEIAAAKADVAKLDAAQREIEKTVAATLASLPEIVKRLEGAIDRLERQQQQQQQQRR